jgi:tetratricopeptide (TPR) repeat protein
VRINIRALCVGIGGLVLVGAVLFQFAGSALGGILPSTVPLTPDELYQRADQKRMESDYEGAIRDLDEALRARPDWVEAYIRRGDVHFFAAATTSRRVEWERANEDYTRALEMDPTSRPALAARAYARVALGDYQGVVADETAALAIDPTVASSYYYRAHAHLQLCNVAEATRDYETAVALFQELRAEEWPFHLTYDAAQAWLEGVRWSLSATGGLQCSPAGTS